MLLQQLSLLQEVKEEKDLVEVKRLKGKIAGVIVGAILVAALIGIAKLWGKGANQKHE